jgi:glycosyltransferase involved in cell wall biosynthesis
MRSAEVSVVIPVRDHAQLLREAIESVLDQTQPPGEIVVVDDGSTDDSGGVAASYRGVRVVRQDGRGIGGARNAGVAVAHGALLAFLDADDRWTRDKLELQLAALRDDVDVVSGWTAQVPQSEWRDAVRRPPERATWRYAPMPGALLIRRTAFDRVGQYDETLRAGESLDWYARATHAGTNVVVVPHLVLLRRVHAESHGTRHAEGYVDYLSVARMAVARRRQREAAE